MAREIVRNFVRGGGWHFMIALPSHRVEGKASKTHVEMMIVATFGRRRWFVLSTAEVAATTQTTTAETTGRNAANQEQRLKLKRRRVQ